MTPQLVDLNADGHQDMIFATFEGTAFLVEGSDKGWKEPKHIVDKNDDHVRISLYYDMDKREYLSVDRSTDDYKSEKGHHLTSIALVDWDDDGDLDLVLGAYEGALYLCLNEGSATEPKFAEYNHQVLAGGKHLTLKGGLATPRIADWNGDGLFDILCGGSAGGVYFYRNVGEQGKPKFAAAETLIAKAKYDDKGMIPSKDGVPAYPGKSFHIETVDYDGDGDLDLLVGARSRIEREESKLSEAEAEELASVRKQLDSALEKRGQLFEEHDLHDNDKLAELQKEILRYRDSETEEERQKLLEAEANELVKTYMELESETSRLYSRLFELQPPQQPANLVWLYRNRGQLTESIGSQ